MQPALHRHTPTAPAAVPVRSARASADSRAPTTLGGLQPRQVFHHVATLLKNAPIEVAIDRLAETANLCGLLLATRRHLFVALNAHQRIERLSQLAKGREQAQLLNPQALVSLQSVEKLMQSCVDDVLGQWRRVGQNFSRLTHLLPTQLDHQLGFPANLTPEQCRALMSYFMRVQGGVPAARFDAAMDAYMGARRRCQARVGPALAARERRRRAELDRRGSGTAIADLALALFEEFLSRQSLLVAEGERASAHFVLHLMVDMPAALRGQVHGT